MIGDKNKFQSLRRMNRGKVKFEGNSLARVVGIGSLVLNDGETKVENILYVKGLKHNLLSVSQLCDEGYDLVFNSKYHVINKREKHIANATKVENNCIFLIILMMKSVA